MGVLIPDILPTLVNLQGDDQLDRVSNNPIVMLQHTTTNSSVSTGYSLPELVSTNDGVDFLHEVEQLLLLKYYIFHGNFLNLRDILCTTFSRRSLSFSAFLAIKALNFYSQALD